MSGCQQCNTMKCLRRRVLSDSLFEGGGKMVIRVIEMENWLQLLHLTCQDMRISAHLGDLLVLLSQEGHRYHSHMETTVSAKISQ